MDADRLRTESLRIVGLTGAYLILNPPKTEQEVDEFVDGAIRATEPLFIGDPEQLKEAVHQTIDLLLASKLEGERPN